MYYIERSFSFMSDEETTIIELTEKNIESMIYEIRGQKIMLDFDLARIYGYTTKRFNEQVKNNIEKFPEDFMFRLSKEELDNLQRCTFCTPDKSEIKPEENERSQIMTMKISGAESEESSWSKKSTLNKSGDKRGYNTKYLPYAFTEQGIYMLMTVLKGELAVKQSLAIIRLFKRMKDYIISSDGLLSTNELLRLSRQVNENKESIASLKEDNQEIKNQLQIVMDNFVDPSSYELFIILNGQKMKADIAYQTIYSLAKHSIIIIDDYIGVKTLDLLLSAKKEVEIFIVSDNVSRNSVKPEYVDDFINESGTKITIKPSNGLCHDRLIVIDYQTPSERVYSSGASSKDAGNSMTTIMKIGHPELYHSLIEKLVFN